MTPKIGTPFIQETSSVRRQPSSKKSIKRGKSVLRPRSWTRPWKERESGSGALRPSSSFRRSASTFLVLSPRSGTGATQSYWHRGAILAAEGDWRFQGARSRIGALRDDRVGGLRKFSSSRERSELSISLITLHAPLSTVLNRTLDNALSPLLPTTHNEQRTTDLKSTHPVGRGMPPPLSQRGS